MGSNNQVVTTDSSGGFSILPQVEPYVSTMGSLANQLLLHPNTNPLRFAEEQPLALPDWSTVNYAPLESQYLQLTQNLVNFGVPTPEAETLAMQWMQQLPSQIAPISASPFWDTAGETARQVASLGFEQPRETAGFDMLNQSTAGVPVSNLFNRALNTAGGIAQVAQPTGQEQLAEQSLTNLTTGDMGNTLAVQSAIEGLEANIVPMLENRAATMGLANSGQLVNEIGQAYAGTLTPLYMQGMQQQESSANALSNMGNTMASRQMAGLQSLRDTQLAAGQNEQALQTEQLMRQFQAGQAQLGASNTIAQRGMSGLTNLQNLYQNQAINQQQLLTDSANRYLTAATGATPVLNSIAGAQTQRFLTPMQQAAQAGNIQHGRALEQRQFVLDPYLRQREMALSLMNPSGVSIISTSPTSTTQNTTSSGYSK